MYLLTDFRFIPKAEVKPGDQSIIHDYERDVPNQTHDSWYYTDSTGATKAYLKPAAFERPKGITAKAGGGYDPVDSFTPTAQETASGLFTTTSNPRSLSRKLENIKMHKDGFFGAVNNIELRHNSVVFYRIHRKHHRNTERELYNKADHQVNRQLQHGGHPSYFHFEGFDNRAKNYTGANPNELIHARSVDGSLYRRHPIKSGQQADINDTSLPHTRTTDYTDPGNFILDHFKIHREPLDARDGYKYHNELVAESSESTGTTARGPMFRPGSSLASGLPTFRGVYWDGLDACELFQTDTYNATFRNGYDGMVDNTDHAEDAAPCSETPRVHLSQWQQLQVRAPTESKWGLCEKYLPELYNEIGCKDLPAEVLCAYKAGYYYKLALQGLRNEGGIEIPCGFEIPHPWHYNVSDAFPILNLVNDLNITVNLNKMGQWIQNYEEVSRIWDYHIRHPRMLVTYYDIPKRVWDQQFPINRQMNYTKHDYQMWEHNIKVDIQIPTLKVPVNPYGTGQNPDGLSGSINNTAWNNMSFNHDPDAATHQVDCRLDNFDGVARYLMLQINGEDHSVTGDWDYDGFSFCKELLERAYLMVGEEMVNDAKCLDATEVTLMKSLIQRHQHFKESEGNFLPGSCIYFPLGLDGDIHNYGGGTVNMKPFHMQFKLRLVFSPHKIWKLYNSGLPYMRKTSTTRGTNEVMGATNTSTCINSNWLDGAGCSPHGFIERTSDTTLQLNLRVRTSALILSLVTLEGGQLYSNG